jgi:hypothetical protein
MKRKHISWKTKCASTLIAPCRNCGYVLFDYDDAKLMTEDQLLSLLHWDHNILHETGHKDRDKYWNLTPKLIKEHREKTKQDAKVVAKGKRIRAKLSRDAAGAGNHVARLRLAPLRTDPDEAGGVNFRASSIRPLSGSHKLRSRGFDKTRTRGFDGKVRERRK